MNQKPDLNIVGEAAKPVIVLLILSGFSNHKSGIYRRQGSSYPNTALDGWAKVIAPPADGFRGRQGCVIVLGNQQRYLFQRSYPAPDAAIAGQVNRSY